MCVRACVRACAASQGAGGFDDFGTLLRAAAVARQEAQQRAADRAAQKQQQQQQQLPASSSGLGRDPSIGGDSSVGGAALSAQTSTRLQGQASGYPPSSPGGRSALQPSYSVQSSVIYQDTPRGGDASAGGGGGGGWGGYDNGGEAAPPAEEAAASALVVGSRVQAMYEFSAESADELGVAPGEELEVTAVMEEWLQVRSLSLPPPGLSLSRARASYMRDGGAEAQCVVGRRDARTCARAAWCVLRRR